MALSKTVLCGKHGSDQRCGGGQRCEVVGCDKVAQGKSGMCCRCETKAKAKTKCKNPELSWDCFYLLFMFVLRMMDSKPAHETCRMFF